MLFFRRPQVELLQPGVFIGIEMSMYVRLGAWDNVWNGMCYNGCGEDRV